MNPKRGRLSVVGAALVTCAWVLPAPARAEDPKVDLRAEVILASNQGTAIEPASLSSVKDEFASAGIVFTSYKQLSAEKLSLDKQHPAEVKLPNGKTASLKLEDLKDGKATVKVRGLGAEVVIQLGREGSVFQRVGAHQGGQLILMLTPGRGPKPRSAPPGCRVAAPQPPRGGSAVPGGGV